MLKLIAGGIILFGCGYAGVLFANRLKNRTRQLAELQGAMAGLEYCIAFLHMPIADSLESVSKNCQSGLKLVFLYISERLRSSPAGNMERVWQRSIEKYRQSLALKDDDIEIVLDFAKNFGCRSIESEKNNIKVTAMRLKIAQDEAMAELKQNSKMYRGLGFLFGIFVIILLI